MQSRRIIESALADCTPAQREAISHINGPLLVIAGPGSGKTRVITRRITHLVGSGIDPRRILAITFTNKAAGEMRERVESLGCARGAWLFTFHAFCARVLREYGSHVGLGNNFSIYDTADTLNAVKRAVERLEIDKALFKPAELARRISDAKGKMWGPDDLTRSHIPNAETAARVYKEYTSILRAANAADFDDLLMLAVRLLTRVPSVSDRLRKRFAHVLIDEYQDTNHAQYLIAKHLTSGHRNLCATGDPDQSIYGWRGADINNILEFERDYPDARVVRLEQNYRSVKAVLRAADRLIVNNAARKEKALFTENPEGERPRVLCCEDESDEAERVAGEIASLIRSGDAAPKDVAVFYRVNAQSRVLETSLRADSIPYQIVAGTEFYQRREIKDVLAYLRLVANPADDVAAARVLNVPARRIGATSLNRLNLWAMSRTMPLTDALPHAQEAGVRGPALGGIKTFLALLKELRAMPPSPVAPIVEKAIARAGYENHLRAQAEDADERVRNVHELINDAAEFNEAEPEGDLQAFLERAALFSETDNWDPTLGRVALMTLHAAKGLEFPVVFVVGLEEKLLPLAREEVVLDLEEERRLLFVGITRAKRRLILAYAESRARYVRHEYSEPSRFIEEMRGEIYEEPGRHALSRTRLFSSPGSAAFGRSARPSRGFGRRRILKRVSRGNGEEIVYDGETPFTEADVAAPFKPGDRVIHPTYGRGRVLGLSGYGESLTAAVQFPVLGVKKLRLIYARLKLDTRN